jgi:hypothetical protein
MGAHLGSTTLEVSIPVPPGTYDLQLVFFRSFLSSPPSENANEKEFERFEEQFDRGELFRSNSVRIIVQERGKADIIHK